MRKEQDMTAIIYDKRGVILSVGRNSYVKTHTIMAKLGASVGLEHKIYLHAEVDAIIKCRDISKAYKIFVSRTMRDGTLGLAKPCPVCSKAIELSGIKIIQHT